MSERLTDPAEIKIHQQAAENTARLSAILGQLTTDAKHELLDIINLQGDDRVFDYDQLTRDDVDVAIWEAPHEAERLDKIAIFKREGLVAKELGSKVLERLNASPFSYDLFGAKAAEFEGRINDKPAHFRIVGHDNDPEHIDIELPIYPQLIDFEHDVDRTRHSVMKLKAAARRSGENFNYARVGSLIHCRGDYSFADPLVARHDSTNQGLEHFTLYRENLCSPMAGYTLPQVIECDSILPDSDHASPEKFNGDITVPQLEQLVELVTTAHDVNPLEKED